MVADPFRGYKGGMDKEYFTHLGNSAMSRRWRFGTDAPGYRERVETSRIYGMIGGPEQADNIPLTRREYERELKAEEFRKMMGWPSRITLRRYKS